MAPIITLTTDFGLADGYVASMKGVILSICPSATIVDVTHEVPPQGVLHGAFVLSAAYSFFPPGAVHVAVVDPGVGTARKPIGIAWKGYSFIGPDNGIFTLVLGGAPAVPAPRRGPRRPVSGPPPTGAQVYELLEPRYHLADVSATFHGRDVFAPAAAHLAAGVPLAEMGPLVSSLCYLGVSAPAREERGVVRGVVIHVDAFGNAITNLRREDVPEGEVEVRAGKARVRGISRTYADRDGALAVWGSSGYLEIAVRNGNAAKALGLKTGSAVGVMPLQRK